MTDSENRSVPFSRRIPADLRPNALARLRAELGEVPFDLTVSNPTRCGIAYPGDLLAGLSDQRGLVYDPEPLGLEAARRAVADDYARRGIAVDPARVALVASTSEAYSLLFKTLADPGDDVLVPAPSYPLFEHLARLDGIAARPYALDPLDGWRADPEVVARGSGKIAIAVHPNNPTGSYLDRPTAARLVEACAEARKALLVDEVFFDYPLAEPIDAASFAGLEMPGLVFTLGGLSKQVGLPQLKLAWIVAGGPAAAVDEALARLAFAADQYLSVATPVQIALAGLLERGAVVRAAILARCRGNLAALRRVVATAPAVTLVEPQGGFSAVLRVPSSIDEEALVLDALREDGVAVHPGYFFGFPREGWLVTSLLPPPAIFREGLELLLRRI